MPRVAPFALLLLCASAFASPPPDLPYTLPATLESGRFFVAPVTEDGVKLRLFTDSGGGFFFSKAAAKRLGIAVDESFAGQLAANEDAPQMMAWPHWAQDTWIPSALSRPTGVAVLQPPQNAGAAADSDGMLGGPWFGGRCWQFDYPGAALRLLPNGALPDVDAAHRIALGLKADDDTGQYFARITARIDGEDIDLLFDTGASGTLTAPAMKIIDDGKPATRSTSFIVHVVAERWRAAHPDWRYIEAGETTGAALIDVPNVEVAGHHTGPVWFTLREDHNFHDHMSQWMDKRVDGALGGNAFAPFRITVDYPSATATFERP